MKTFDKLKQYIEAYSSEEHGLVEVKLLTELSTEIERLTKLCESTSEYIKVLEKAFNDRTKENAELQKQVDELKEQFLSTCENCHLKKDIELLNFQKEQAVKDTAKEICEMIDAVKEVFPNDYRGYDMAHGWSMCVDKLKEIIKSKGVEVE